jgi:hypothetical protein
VRQTFKDIPLDGQQYRLSKWTPLDAIWVRDSLLRASMQAYKPPKDGEPEPKPAKDDNPPTEEELEQMVGGQWSVYGSLLDEGNYRRVQVIALRSISRLVSGQPVPIFMQNGNFAFNLDDEETTIEKLIRAAIGYNLCRFLRPTGDSQKPPKGE